MYSAASPVGFLLAALIAVAYYVTLLFEEFVLGTGHGREVNTWVFIVYSQAFYCANLFCSGRGGGSEKRRSQEPIISVKP